MKLWNTALLITIAAAPLLAGALTLQLIDPTAAPEAKQKHAVLAARVTACNSPEKNVVSATAEGVVNGKRQAIPLTVIALSTPGTFAVTHEWPRNGNWVVRWVAANPDYKNYKTGLIVAMNGDTFETASVKTFYREPLPQDADEALNLIASR